MNAHSLRKLAIVAALLVAGLLIVNLNLTDNGSTGGDLFLPDLKGKINGIEKITISASADRPKVSIAKEDGNWVVVERQNFPANTAKLRQLLLALADAKTLEPKTSNAARYSQLGVEGGESPASTTVTISGTDLDIAVIIGNEAQTSYRFARIDGDTQSWLINVSPEIPEEVGEWLNDDVIDIAASAVRSVSIRHADGEQLRIFKEATDDADFQVDGIPEGRELTYPSAANGIGGVLDGMTLDDVMGTASFEGEAVANTRFEMFDGSEVVIDTYGIDDQHWISIAETGSDDIRWLYRLPEYKTNLLMRRWDDILKEQE